MRRRQPVRRLNQRQASRAGIARVLFRRSRIPEAPSRYDNVVRSPQRRIVRRRSRTPFETPAATPLPSTLCNVPPALPSPLAIPASPRRARPASVWRAVPKPDINSRDSHDSATSASVASVVVQILPSPASVRPNVSLRYAISQKRVMLVFRLRETEAAVVGRVMSRNAWRVAAGAAGVLLLGAVDSSLSCSAARRPPTAGRPRRTTPRPCTWMQRQRHRRPQARPSLPRWTQRKRPQRRLL